jgi:hypothetical protein
MDLTEKRACGNGKLVIAFQQAERQLFVMINVSPLPIQFKVGMRWKSPE